MRKQTSLSFGLTLTVLLLAGWGCGQKKANVTADLSNATGQAAYNEQATASIAVANQALIDSTLTLPKVVLNNDGWVAIHADKGGVPGEIIGQVAVSAGEHKDVKVRVSVDGSNVTPIVHAMLHVDAGIKGTFEFPGADVPVTANGVAITGSFQVTKPVVDTKTSADIKVDVSGEVKPEVKVETKTEVKAEVKPAVKSFTITAKSWEFSPSTITVKKGDTVRLTIKSVDVEHGFFLPAFNVNADLQPGKTATVEFVADKAGTFSFKCNVLCGEGHGGMNGKLVVE